MWPMREQMLGQMPSGNEPRNVRWLTGQGIALDVTSMVRVSVTGVFDTGDTSPVAYDVSVVLQLNYDKGASSETRWTVWTTPDKREADLVLQTISKWICINGLGTLVIADFLATRTEEEARKTAATVADAEKAAKM